MVWTFLTFKHPAWKLPLFLKLNFYGFLDRPWSILQKQPTTTTTFFFFHDPHHHHPRVCCVSLAVVHSFAAWSAGVKEFKGRSRGKAVLAARCPARIPAHTFGLYASYEGEPRRHNRAVRQKQYVGCRDLWTKGKKNNNENNNNSQPCYLTGLGWYSQLQAEYTGLH